MGSKSSTCATFGLISIDHINIIFFQAPVTHTGRGAAELVIFSPLPSTARPIICLVYHCDFLPLYYLPQHTLQVTAEQGFCTAALQSLAELGRPPPQTERQRITHLKTGCWLGFREPNSQSSPQEDVTFNCKQSIWDKGQHSESPWKRWICPQMLPGQRIILGMRNKTNLCFCYISK